MTRTKRPNATEIMVVNDSPGEECRIAILEDDHLEELYTERTATATGVGNIYKGRVTRVEPAIQAAFVDYGGPASGFLHISDLHPRYFPRGDKTERVGKRTARRDRPLMQEALRSGQEVLVQVLKEGIGTKGPTLTSYLSIPGRLMVMMPDMDRVGVSRKVEDEDKRRQMREILDSLDLPDGFGFILRTAGFDKTKTDLKRDVAYLTRLWKVMEARMKGVGAPCELYTESDLLIRTVRDVLRPSISAIVVDSKSAYDRTSAFLRVVAPRSAPKVIRYRGHTPIFHAFDIERQIELIHSRTVPLPSGGHLVIEQTEALVAIDVNSGRSRSAQDSETNAFRTNCEAVDEIARQLRLRDLGGLIIHDLIDMRASRHRAEIEHRFEEHLKRDRARWTINHISEFGVLEMTRQRMRPSLRKSHYMPCPHCEGRGEVKIPESLGADAVRQIAYLLQFERVKRVELVCSSRVASVLLSRKRRELVRLEAAMNKTIDVRVSETIAIDRVDYYAYDDRGADIDIERLPQPHPPSIEELAKAQPPPELPDDVLLLDEDLVEAEPSRRKRGPADAMQLALSGELDLPMEFEEDEELEDEPGASAGAQAPPEGAGQIAGEPGRKRRRRRRRGRGGRGGQGGAFPPQHGESGAMVAPQNGEPSVVPDRSIDGADAGEVGSTPIGQPGHPAPLTDESGGQRRSRRRRRGRRGRGGAPPSGFEPAQSDAPQPRELDQPSHTDQPHGEDDSQSGAILVPADDDTSGDDSEFRDNRAQGASSADDARVDGSQPQGGPRRRRRRRRGRRGGGNGQQSFSQQPPHSAPPQPPRVEGAAMDGNPPAGKKRRRRRRRRSGAPDGAGEPGQMAGHGGRSESSPPVQREPSAAPPGTDSSQPKAGAPRRGLYRNRTRISPTARVAAQESDE